MKKRSILNRKIVNVKTAFLSTATIWLLLCTCLTAHTQTPRAITVYVNPGQGLVFGAFFHGVNGGTVTVDPDGMRSVTGDIMQANLGNPISSVLFEIDADPATSISILNGPDVQLTGSNGGSITLHIGDASTGPSFITSSTPPSLTQVRIGGTLSIGNALANPAGIFSGSFSVTFIQE